MRMPSSPALPAVLLSLAACQTTGVPVDLPPPLAVAPQETAIATLAARGVQIYECRDTGGRPGWVFIAPEADLFDRDGRLAGRHGAGPYWEAVDGSRIEAKVLARAEAPRSGAIPWLLLEARSTGGPGALEGVTRVRRVSTVGGREPEAGCDGRSIGTRVNVPYTADYLFHAGRRL